MSNSFSLIGLSIDLKGYIYHLFQGHKVHHYSKLDDFYQYSASFYYSKPANKVFS